jgi:protein TonB
MRVAVIASAVLHTAVLLLLLGLHHLHLPSPPPAQLAQVEVILKAPGGGEAAARVAQPAPVSAPPQPPAPQSPSQSPLAEATSEPPPQPSPPEPSHASPSDVRLGDPGNGGFTSEVSGENVVPASPENTKGNIPPRYPFEAVLLREQGMVSLTIHVEPTGRVAEIDIVRSSGFRLLDQAARTALLRWRFKPALRDGQPIASELPYNIQFVLHDPGQRKTSPP